MKPGGTPEHPYRNSRRCLFAGLVLLLAWVWTLALPGCGGATGENHPARPAEPGALVLVAASTTDLLEDLAARFNAAHNTPDAVRIAPGPTNALARQIIQGAPADLFVAANQRWADEVVRAGLAVSQAPWLANTLVLIVPAGNPAGVHGPEDLTSASLRFLALAGEQVPAGIYAGQALQRLGLAGTLAERIVRGHDVRATLAWVERGEAGAGVVYATDARMSPGVEVVHTFAPDLHDPIVYPLLRLTHGRDNRTAQAFAEYLRSADAAAVCTAHGFRRAD